MSELPPPRRVYPADAYDPERPPESWWRASAPPLDIALAPLEGDATCDVAIIGAGFTGLQAALRLARDHGADVRVLEMGAIGFGASGRNGGFCCIPAMKLSWRQLLRRYGLEETQRFFRAQAAAVAHVAETLEREDIDAQTTSHGGEICLAHRAEEVPPMREEAAFLKRTFDVDAQVFDREALRQIGADGPTFHGALAFPIGFGVHPLRYLRGLARAAHRAGATLHPRTEARAIQFTDPGCEIDTPNGRLRARRLIVATNGYGSETAPRWFSGRVLPALSSVFVTRPLTEDELRAQGFTTQTMAYDTRRLVHYFRRLADNRFLFGGRGGVDSSPRALAARARDLRARFDDMFPAWAHVETTHEWSGLVALSGRRLPYIGPIDGRADAWTAVCYHGNGVATGSWSGAQLADLAVGAQTHDALPAALRGPLPRFPFPALRRTYLRAAYTLYARADGP